MKTIMLGGIGLSLAVLVVSTSARAGTLPSVDGDREVLERHVVCYCPSTAETQVLWVKRPSGVYCKDEWTDVGRVACGIAWGTTAATAGFVATAGCVGVSGGLLTPGCVFAFAGWTGALLGAGGAICGLSPAKPSPYHIFGDNGGKDPGPGNFGAGESPQFSPAVPADVIPTEGWFPFTDSVNGNHLLGTVDGEPEASLGNDSGGHGVLPDNGAILYGGGSSGGEVALGGEVSVGSNGYVIGDPDPNDDQGDVPADPGGDGD
jgi:hypothetical protein